MQAKFVYESLEDILKPKSEEEILKAMNDSGLSPNELLVKSVKTNFLKGVQLALEKGAYVHYGDDWPLMWASEYGYLEIVKLLLEAGADVHAINDYALRIASYYGNLNVIKVLLEAGADVHAKNDEAILKAIQFKHVNVINLLKQYMNKGVNESIKDILKPKSEEEILKAMDVSGLSPDDMLEKSAEIGFTKGVQLALKKGANVHARYDEALRYASECGYLEVVKELLKAGANVHAINNQALRFAAENGHLEVVKVLLEAGADVHAWGDYALHYASKYGHRDVVNLLKQYMNKGVNESNIEQIKPSDILNTNTFKIYNNDSFVLELFMYNYAYQNGLNPDEMNVDEWSTSKEGEKWIKYEIETMFQKTLDMFLYEVIDSDEITIWRKMTVPKNWIEHLEKQGGRLGIYWSWKEKSAEEHWGYDSNKDLAKIESSINVNDVNWIDTIITNMNPSNEGEDEIRLFKNTPIKINRLWINDIEVDISFVKNKIFKA